jgi:hypothetical protein
VSRKPSRKCDYVVGFPDHGVLLLVIPAFYTKSDYLVSMRSSTGSASYAKDFFSINLNLLFDLSPSSPEICGVKFGERSQQLRIRRTSARLVPVEKPRCPLIGPVATHRPGVYSALPSRHLSEPCGAPPYYSRRPRLGLPRARGSIQGRKNTVTPVARPRQA